MVLPPSLSPHPLVPMGTGGGDRQHRDVHRSDTGRLRLPPLVQRGGLGRGPVLHAVCPRLRRLQVLQHARDI